MMKLLHFALTHLPHASEGTETRWKHGRAFRRAEHELSALSDSDLRDLGISRGEIPYAVRYGRRG